MCQRSRVSVLLHADVMGWVPLGSSRVPLAAVMPGMARQTPPSVSSLLMVPVRTTVHFLLLLAEPQVQSTAFLLRTMMHLLPNIRSVPSDSNVQAWPAVPLHQNMSTTLPFTPEL